MTFIKYLKVVVLAILLTTYSSCSNNAGSGTSSGDEGFTFAFLTDTHVEYGKNADKGFQAAIDHVNKAAPEFVITGGDQISDALGQTEETATELYDLYLKMEKGFNMPVYNTLGNHEEFGIYEKSGIDRTHELYGHKMYEAKIGKRFYSFDHKGWKFYILDSVEETEERRYFGHVDSVQIEWLKQDLENIDKETPVVVVTHIPFVTAYAQIREGSLAQNASGLVVENSREVLDLFEGYNLKLVLQGHLHILEEVYIDGIHFITGGAVSARWWDGPKDGLEEGYLMVRINGEKIDWEYIDFGWEVN
ncbi:MAG: metallophosphoesterase [Bacteroidales bacterium]|nr:metallophosphoesterase [Bacteroidales bacterium]